MPVVAYNKKGQKQIFSDMAWKLLGKDKNGWTEKPSQVIQNKQKIEPPQMGPMPVKETQVLENKTKPESKDPVLENQNPSNDVEETNDQPVNETKNKDLFLDAVKGINKTVIKDFFDAQNPPIKYRNNASDQVLQNQLAEHLNYDIVELQKIIG